MIAAVVKMHKRLHIVDVETGGIVYAPPSFLRVPNRATLAALAFALNAKGSRDIGEIMAFEGAFTRRQ